MRHIICKNQGYLLNATRNASFVEPMFWTGNCGNDFYKYHKKPYNV